MFNIQNISSSISVTSSNLVGIALALALGMLPALLWLFFWLREDKEDPVPTGLVMLTFLAGMISVMLVYPIEKYISFLPLGDVALVFAWAGSEEIMKFLAVYVIALRSQVIAKPVDYAIFCITGALGFAALENALFLVHPILTNDTLSSILTGNLRFMGATLLHSVTTGLVGIMLGLTYSQKPGTKILAVLFGLMLGTALHGVFNLFIINGNGQNTFSIFAIIWVVTVIIILLFEKLRRMSEEMNQKKQIPSPLVPSYNTHI